MASVNLVPSATAVVSPRESRQAMIRDNPRVPWALRDLCNPWTWARQQAKLRIPPTAGQVDHLFAGWREELATCRKFAPTARNYTACRLMSVQTHDTKAQAAPLRAARRPGHAGQP